MKKIYPKMKVLEWSKLFFHSKSTGIFPDAQGQLTHKSLVQSCRISDPFEILWFFSIPARIEKNQSKMKELEWSQDLPIITLWELSVAMEIRVLSDLAQNLMQSKPYPNDDPD